MDDLAGLDSELSWMARNARIYVPRAVLWALQDMALDPRLVLVLDMEALSASLEVPVDRILIHALDALSRSDVQIVLVSIEATKLAARLLASVPGALWFDRFEERDHGRAISYPDTTGPAADILDHLRDQFRGVRLIAIGRDEQMFSALGEEDRAIELQGRARRSLPTRPVLTGSVSLRAMLWWLVGVRARSGLDLA